MSNHADSYSERFTPRVHRVLEFARVEALGEGETSILTRHLLVALGREGHGLIARLLGTFGVSFSALDTARQNARKEPAHGGLQPPDVEVAALFPVAAEEADALGSTYIGTEHLLLAMLRVEESTAGHLLAANGVRPDAIRSMLAARTALRDEAPPPDAPQAGSQPGPGLRWERWRDGRRTD